MRMLWYVTASTDPSKRLGGPYDTRDECERACLTLTDTHSTIEALANGKLPGYYVPRPFKEESKNADTRAGSFNQLLRERPTQRTSVTHTSRTDGAYVSTTSNVSDTGLRPTLPRTRKQSKPRIKLPDNIYRFERAELLELAEALGMNRAQLVALKPNKHELVAIMEAYLSSEDG